MLAQETCSDTAHSAVQPARVIDEMRFHQHSDKRKSDSKSERESFPGEQRPSPVLRVGYVSYDWRDHPMGR